MVTRAHGPKACCIEFRREHLCSCFSPPGKIGGLHSVSRLRFDKIKSVNQAKQLVLFIEWALLWGKKRGRAYEDGGDDYSANT